ncbi:MAG TPA: hypothetical protein V6C72_02900, partial [Chroococcales cyanobacterium]
RQFWRGDPGQIGQLATRLTGSSDIYAHSGRSPHASINFVTCHDGFTMTDLVSYNEKHNMANLEDNRDGESHNNSWNCGVEGPTDDAKILTVRMQQRRNLMATLLLSLGVPMISGGDELGRTQQGNNNAYCQDNDLSWTHWDLPDSEKEFLEFCQKLAQIRKSHPVFERRKFYKGKVSEGMSVRRDVIWLDMDATELTAEGWNNWERRQLAAIFDGAHTDEMDEDGNRAVGSTLLILINSFWKDVPFMLPPNLKEKYWSSLVGTGGEKNWELILETTGMLGPGCWELQSTFKMKARSLALFELTDKAKHDSQSR